MRGILAEYTLININDSVIKEAQDAIASGGPLVIRGILQSANKKNRNGRVYPREILAKQIEEYLPLIKERRALGELDHPNSAEVNLSNTSHLVTNIWWEADDVMGEVEILDTPAGKIAKQLIAQNVKLGISSRGVGSVVESEEGTVVQDDFNLIGFDLVSMPSTHGAFLHESEEKEPKQAVDVSGFNKVSARILERN